MTASARSPASWLRRTNLRLVAIAVAAALMIMTPIVIIITAPISEIMIHIKNSEETETLGVEVWLETSQRMQLYIAPGNWTGWIFHVSPGTHTVFLTSNLDYLPSEREADFEMKVKVGFNGMCERAVRVNQSEIDFWVFPEIEPNIIWVRIQRSSPIEQAMSDPYVLLPMLALAAVHGLLVAAIWFHRRSSLMAPSSRLEGRP